MVLALDYMRRTGQDQGPLAERAREYVASGYERLLGFEVREEPGGFDWWGKPPANLFLTAYALFEFHDLARVHPVDPALLARISAWLRAKQQPDGSWSGVREKEAWSTDIGRAERFHLTAYVAWGLARTGQPSASALAWLAEHAAESKDPYGMALGALALLTADPRSAPGHALVARLAALAVPADPGVAWHAGGPTGVGARGESATLETTALAVQALQLAGADPALVARGVERLLAARGADGRFGTTQSTILVLRALLAVEPGKPARGRAKLGFRLGGRPAGELAFDPDALEPGRLDLGTAAGDLVIEQQGGARTRITLARTTWVPWTERAPAGRRLALAVAWPTTPLVVGRVAHAEARVSVRPDGAAASVVTLEIGLPPGCDVELGDVKAKGAERVERGERVLVVYYRDLAPGEARNVHIPFVPRYALEVLTAPSTAYEYYVPEEAAVVAPSRVRAAPAPR
jgi:hypothetical protein